MADAKSGGVAANSSAAVTPRRPRVREVSSRFLTTPLRHSRPIPTTPYPTNLPQSKSVQRCKTDENHIPNRRSFDSSYYSSSTPTTIQRKLYQKTTREIGNEPRDHHQRSPKVRLSSRLNTPVPTATDRSVPSRYKLDLNIPVPPSTSCLNSSTSSGCSSVTTTARHSQGATPTLGKKVPRILTSKRDESNAYPCSPKAVSWNQESYSCPNSPFTKQENIHDMRSSDPNVDKLLAENNCHSGRKGTISTARSLNFSSSMKVGGGVPQPPPPSSHVRSGNQDDVHSLRMLRYKQLQWQFANAKAEAAMQVQKSKAESQLCSVASKISDKRRTVQKMRRELAVLKVMQMLNTVVEAQMPLLEEWSDLEEDNSTSLTGTTDALLNSMATVPVTGNIRFDAAELHEAMKSPLKVSESIGSHIEGYMQKAEEMDATMSKLGRAVSGEKSLLQECGYRLTKTRSLQVTECSLRGSLIQLMESNRRNS